jgi:uncharacterized protein (TIGR00266 family)
MRGELGRMHYEVVGTVMQALKVDLQPGERLISQSGVMTWMTDNMIMDTNFQGGFLKSLGRKLAGGTLALTYFEPKHGPGQVGFTTLFPGKIIPMEIRRDREIICQKDAFLVSQDSVDLQLYLQRKFGAGFFGGDGFFMQKLTGNGLAFIEVDGEVLEFDLKPGETIRVHASHVAAFESSIDFDVQMMRGIKNIFFGGEGLFLATLTGPGKVWLHTVTVNNMAAVLAPRIGTRESGFGLGGVIEDFLND